MDSFERQLVQFVVLWAPFGGPPAEEMLPSFGLSPPLLARRFNQIVSDLAQTTACLNEDDAHLLAEARRAMPALRRAGSAHDRQRICSADPRETSSAKVTAPHERPIRQR